MNKFLAQALNLPQRTLKSREEGITHVLDKGMGLAQTRDLLETSADYIDIVKFGWGTGFLTKGLKEKIELYHQYDIPVCFGGTLFEVFVIKNKVDQYVSYLQDLGVTHVEISDGSLFISPQDKLKYIHQLKSKFIVLSEVGQKDPAKELSIEQWGERIQEELHAGAWKVITEARESGTVGIYTKEKEVRQDLLSAILEKVEVKDLLFETPLKEQQVWFIKKFGANVNLGNIASSEVIPCETLRLGLRGDTFTHFHL